MHKFGHRNGRPSGSVDLKTFWDMGLLTNVSYATITAEKKWTYRFVSEVLMSEFVKDVSDQDFDSEVLQSDQPVLVDFWAAWCAPCRMIAPTVDQVAQDYSGRAKVVKLNVDDNRETSARYNIRGIPTLLLFKDGEVKDQIVGATSKDQISRIIDAQL